MGNKYKSASTTTDAHYNLMYWCSQPTLILQLHATVVIFISRSVLAVPFILFDLVLCVSVIDFYVVAG